MPFFERWLFTLIALFFCRMKYYFAWKVSPPPPLPSFLPPFLLFMSSSPPH